MENGEGVQVKRVKEFQAVQDFGEGEGREESSNEVTHECMIN